MLSGMRQIIHSRHSTRQEATKLSLASINRVSRNPTSDASTRTILLCNGDRTLRDVCCDVQRNFRICPSAQEQVPACKIVLETAVGSSDRMPFKAGVPTSRVKLLLNRGPSLDSFLFTRHADHDINIMVDNIQLAPGQRATPPAMAEQGNEGASPGLLLRALT